MSRKIVSWEEWARHVNEQLKDNHRKIDQISDEVAILERKLRPLFDFWMRRQILITLRNEHRPRSWHWLIRRLGHDAYEPLRELEREGLVVVTRSGSHTMYAAKEVEA